MMKLSPVSPPSLLVTASWLLALMSCRFHGVANANANANNVEASTTAAAFIENVINADGDRFLDEEQGRRNLASSNADDFGYSWCDRDDTALGYNWVDLKTTGGSTLVADSSTTTNRYKLGPFNFGFDFDFYGQTYDEFYISTAGAIFFDPSFEVSNFNRCPMTVERETLPPAMIAVYHDDISVKGGVYYQAFASCPIGSGKCTIVQYHGMELAPPPGEYPPYAWGLLCQIIMFENGEIYFQYGSAPLLVEYAGFVDGRGATIGIRGDNGTSPLMATEYTCADSYQLPQNKIESGLSVGFQPTIGTSNSIVCQGRPPMPYEVCSGGETSIDFDWIDVAGDVQNNGESLGLTGEHSTYQGPFSIGFPFDFYGTIYTEFYVSTNGVVYFEDAPFTANGQCPLPATQGDGSPQAFISPYNGDLAVQDDGDIYYEFFGVCPIGYGSCLVVEFHNMELRTGGSGGESMKFEVVLFDSHDVYFQYMEVPPTGPPGTGPMVGIQGDDGSPHVWAHEYSCNGSKSLVNGLAIGFQEGRKIDDGGFICTGRPDDYTLCSGDDVSVGYNWVDFSTRGNWPRDFSFPFYGKNFSRAYVPNGAYVTFQRDEAWNSLYTDWKQGDGTDVIKIYADSGASFDYRFGSGHSFSNYFAQCPIDGQEDRPCAMTLFKTLDMIGPSTVTFEMVLFDNGDILLQYFDIPARQTNVGFATIGIQSKDVPEWRMYYTGPLYPGLAIAFQAPGSDGFVCSGSQPTIGCQLSPNRGDGGCCDPTCESLVLARPEPELADCDKEWTQACADAACHQLGFGSIGGPLCSESVCSGVCVTESPSTVPTPAPSINPTPEASLEPTSNPTMTSAPTTPVPTMGLCTDHGLYDFVCGFNDDDQESLGATAVCIEWTDEEGYLRYRNACWRNDYVENFFPGDPVDDDGNEILFACGCCDSCKTTDTVRRLWGANANFCFPPVCTPDDAGWEVCDKWGNGRVKTIKVCISQNGGNTVEEKCVNPFYEAEYADDIVTCGACVSSS